MAAFAQQVLGQAELHGLAISAYCCGPACTGALSRRALHLRSICHLRDLDSILLPIGAPLGRAKKKIAKGSKL